MAPLITAVGVSFILQFIGLKWNGSAPRNFTTVVPGTKIDFHGVIIPMKAFLVVGLTIPLLIVLVIPGGGHRVLLDGRPMRTPAKAVLLLPNVDLAEAIAACVPGVEPARSFRQ